MEKTINYSEFRNPYDFANPITDIELFAGRKKEIRELKYYLNQAKNSKSPINIAFIGERASGKTSLLNLTEYKANEMGLFASRVDLDEGDIEYQLYFFNKLFNSVFTKVCEAGHFGGFTGKTYDIYLDIVSSYKIPEEKVFCPFLFPLQYAKAMNVNNPNAQVLDESLKHDFRIIQKEINKSIVILFDECDVLSNNRIVLQKLRNIFMNQVGYMLVISGTEKLFPALNEVFSPIIRQFKKITVERFFEEADTKDCIEKPLENIGLNPKKLMDYETRNDITEIHQISSGKPYEIQLLCHVMFRRLQENKDNRMKVNLSVLKEVTDELEKSQNLSYRPLLLKLNEFNDKDLLALSVLCRQSGFLTLDQAWSLEYAFRGERRWSRKEFNEIFQKLLCENFILLQDDKIHFAGDDFDKIYIKYFSREKKLNVSIDNIDINLHIHFKINSLFKKINEKLIPLDLFSAQPIDYDLDNLASDFGADNTNIDDFVDYPHILLELYWPFMVNNECKKIIVVEVHFSLPWIQQVSYYYLNDKSCSELKDLGSEFFDEIKSNLAELSGSLDYRIYHLPTPESDLIIKKLIRTADKNFRDNIILRHITEAPKLYMDNKKLEGLHHAEIYLKYINSVSNLPDYLFQPHLNNAGYMMMSQGKYSLARECFNHMVSKYLNNNDISNYYLPLYNLAILYCLEKHYIKAKKELEKLEEALSSDQFTSNDRFMGCLYILSAKGNNLSHIEEFEIDILEATKQSLNAIKQIIKN